MASSYLILAIFLQIVASFLNIVIKFVFVLAYLVSLGLPRATFIIVVQSRFFDQYIFLVLVVFSLERPGVASFSFSSLYSSSFSLGFDPSAS